ncbi:MAG: phosphatase PAP2 family protein [Bacteroidales bacterium]|nr:phosphatase PAP2 family protein [Bacteroidales bacterium]
MSFFKLKPHILPTDIVLLAYLFITTIYMLIFHSNIESFWQVMGARLLIVVVLVQIILLHKTTNILWVKNLHLLFPIFLMGYLYGETHYMNHGLIAVNLDPYFMEMDQFIFGYQPSILFSKKYNNWLFSELMYMGYISYYFQVIVITLYAYIKEKEKLNQSIFIIFNSFLIYYLVYAILPVVGPQFHLIGADGLPPQSGFFSEFMQQINHNFEKPTGAFPSSHVGMTLVFSYMALKFSKKLFYIFIPFTFLIMFATVYIKAHYAVDILAGILSTPIVYYLSQRMYRVFS